VFPGWILGEMFVLLFWIDLCGLIGRPWTDLYRHDDYFFIIILVVILVVLRTSPTAEK
jgi:hypothetical protein